MLGSSNSPSCENCELGEIAWYKDNSNKTTHEVKTKMPNSLGIYDLIGNVAEWSISGSDPLFHVMGGSFESNCEHCKIDMRELDHANVKMESLGLRLVYYPSKIMNNN